MNIPEGLLIGGMTLAAAYGGSWAAIKVHLHYMRRDIRRAQMTAERAHARLDALPAQVRG